MKIFVAGATGAIGRRLIPMLIQRGHQVTAATRSSGKMDSLRAAGAKPVLLDALDRKAVLSVVPPFAPDVIVHEMTSIGRMKNFKNFDADFAVTNRLRTEGTEHLLAAAKAAGASRFLAQSYTGWPNERSGGRVKSETDPLDRNPPKAMRQSFAAIQKLEHMVTEAPGLTGIALRYGSFYGPGTSIAPGGDIVEALQKRKLPIIGGGAGVWSWIHIDDAASATLLAIENGPAGIYNIVDDDPAEVFRWLPALAQAIGAKAPYRVPAWLGALLIGEAGVSMMTKVRGSSNAKARRLLGWQPRYASWRDGFRHGLTARLSAEEPIHRA